MKILISLLIFLLSSNCYAQQIEDIKKGQAAPYDGYVIDDAFEKKARGYREEGKILKEETVTLRELGELKQVRYDMVRKENEELASENSQLKSRNTIVNVLFFVLGAGLTGLISYGAMKTVK